MSPCCVKCSHGGSSLFVGRHRLHSCGRAAADTDVCTAYSFTVIFELCSIRLLLHNFPLSYRALSSKAAKPDIQDTYPTGDSLTEAVGYMSLG